MDQKDTVTGACFGLNSSFHLRLALPNAGVEEAADCQALKVLVRTWKQGNPDAETRPELVFPIQVEMEVGTIVDVVDKDALTDLKDSCGAEYVTLRAMSRFGKSDIFYN